MSRTPWGLAVERAARRGSWSAWVHVGLPEKCPRMVSPQLWQSILSDTAEVRGQRKRIARRRAANKVARAARRANR